MKHALWALSAVFLLAGWGLVGEGSNLPLYRDEGEFQRLYLLIDSQRPDARLAYRKLRAEFLTAHVTYQDYGGTLIVLGVLLPIFPSAGAALRRSTGRASVLLGLGAMAATATPFAELLSLLLDSVRGEFPWFADAIVLPIIGLPVIWALLLAWGALCAWVTIQARRSRGGTAVHWLRAAIQLLAVWMFLQLLVSVGRGDFLAIPPAVLWFAFYYACLRGLPSEAGRAYDWRAHGPWWGALLGGLIAPLALFSVAAALGDIGGGLFWPLLAMVLGPVGAIAGFAARAARSPSAPGLGSAPEPARD